MAIAQEDIFGPVLSAITYHSEGDAIREACCLEHHVTAGWARRRLMIASLRYLDTFVKIDRAWLFAERLLYVEWVDERALS